MSIHNYMYSGTPIIIVDTLRKHISIILNNSGVVLYRITTKANVHIRVITEVYRHTHSITIDSYG